MIEVPVEEVRAVLRGEVDRVPAEAADLALRDAVDHRDVR
jgi:hypothetical protein